jgi:hypothetical protein
LLLPSPAIKTDSDVDGAIRRALNHWSTVTNITFVVVESKLQSISPLTAADGISLLTIAPTSDNLSIFGEANTTARTRVYYDSQTGDISEADIVINPFPFSEDGTLLQFSTDQTPGTYDLESTLTHEIGHLLGLNHSNVIGSTMQAFQGLNGTYDMPAVTERTLSDSDIVSVRNLYGSKEKTGSVQGRIQNSVEGSLVPAFAHVWLEDVASGRVIASVLTSANGKFNLDGVAPGEYRAMAEYPHEAAVDRDWRGRQKPFRSVEIRSHLRVTADKAASLNYVLVPPQTSGPALNPRYLGINGELSIVPVPASAGAKFTVYVRGEGVDLVPGTGLSITSPFFTIDAASLMRQQFPGSLPVISFDVTVAPNAPAGDYSLRMQANSGETAFIVGAITIN